MMRSESEEKQVVFVSLPSSMMQKFCVWQSHGDTIGELGDAYVHNTLCGKKYEAQVDEQRKFFDSVKEKGNKDGEGK